MLCNVVLYQPNLPQLLNLKAYDDVAKTVAHGLRCAGHETHLTVNGLHPGAERYFLFAGHLMPPDLVMRFPPGTVIFNLEQYHAHLHLFREHLGPSMLHVVDHFQIVDYSEFNRPFWDQLAPVKPVKYLPVPYGDNLVIPQASEVKQDIDVLYYGSIGGARKVDFLIAAMGRTKIRPKTVLMQNIYGEERDHFIARSKIVLSVTADRIFPEVRVSYLLANRKAVISNIHDNDLINPFYRDQVMFSSEAGLEDKLLELLSDDGLRERYASECLQAFKQQYHVDDYIRAIF